MTIALILMREVGVMAILILLGAYNKKKGIFTTEVANGISSFLVTFVLPTLLVNTLQRDKDPATLPAFWTAMVFSSIFLAITVAVSILVFKPHDDPDKHKLERLAAVMPNCGFMGIPLLLAVCGDDSVLYCTAIVAVFQILLWCWAIPMLEKKRPSAKSILINPGTFALVSGLAMFLLEIRLPEICISLMNQISGLNTPLSMLMIGVFLADSNPREAFSTLSIYKVVVFRNLAIPLISIFAIHALGYTAKFGIEFSLSIVILMACASAASSLLLPVRAGMDGTYAAQIVASSAFYSVITLPVVSLIAGVVFSWS